MYTRIAANGDMIQCLFFEEIAIMQMFRNKIVSVAVAEMHTVHHSIVICV